jgi:glucose/arabinose dehydrogenase/mono/diheme cytochrome c family protein
MRLRYLIYSLQLSLFLFLQSVNGQPADSQSTPYADWMEPDFPFFSSILDARKAGGEFPADNLTPRGLVINLDNDLWVCFDTDLLRVAAIWQGKGVTPKSLGPRSYHPWGGKTTGGQEESPEPDGDVWLANGIYPGWQSGDSIHLADPREPAPSPEEVGRGPLPESMGQFKSVSHTNQGVVIEYTAGGTTVNESFSASKHNGQWVVARHIKLGASKTPLNLVLGKLPSGGVALNQAAIRKGAKLVKNQSVWTVQLPRHDDILQFCVSSTASGKAPEVEPKSFSSTPASTRWPEEAISRIQLSKEKTAYVVDNIELPLENPWKRNIRPGDIQFLADGTGVVPALDGDVWLVKGLNGSGGRAHWKRFTSGLHEPMTAAIRDNEIYVFDRNGIWLLKDTDANGEADKHVLFSNAFAQTADMREFPSTLRLAPGGEFIIAKGGQQASTLGKHNGSVLRISADGKRSEVLGYGFRQPSIGVNIRTGLITSSDQEGQYIPSTPLHIVRDHQFYGYLADGLQEREKYPAPIAKPLTWVPHSVNASAISQVWLFGAKLGPLNDGLVHIGFNRPELFRVLLNERGSELQAAVVSITTGFQFPLLNGSVSPADGQLYIAGFQVNGWGNALDTLAGLGRVRYTGKPVTLPNEVIPMDKGVLLRFEEQLDPTTTTNPDSYSMASWHYVRTYQYGSAQYRADEEHGIDWLTPSSAYLSKDGRSVFIGVPGMKPVMQLRVGWSLKTADGLSFAKTAYTTPYELATFDPVAEGFKKLEVDLTPRKNKEQQMGPITIEEGKKLHQMMGCAACHSTDGKDMQKVGPTWNGLYGSRREVVIEKKRETITANEDYIRESILNPSAKTVRGFEKSEYAMPSYAGVLTETQIESLILYVKSLSAGIEGPG